MKGSEVPFLALEIRPWSLKKISWLKAVGVCIFRIWTEPPRKLGVQDVDRPIFDEKNKFLLQRKNTTQM